MKMPETNNRIWLLPVISFTIIALLKALALYILYLQIQKMSSNEYTAFLRKQLFEFWNYFWLFLLIAEPIVYYFIRHRLFNRTWVFLHFIFVTIAFVIFPIISAILPNYLLPHNIVNSFFYYKFLISFFLICGHIFFILTIVKSFHKPEPVHETPGLLDEFVS
jgi:hypothetical protein